MPIMNHPGGLQVFIFRDELSQDAVELSVRANLNEDTVMEFKNALYAELDRSAQQLRLNLENVHSMNSAALGAIVLFQKRARESGKRFMITKCSEELRSMLLAIRLDRIVEMEGEAPPTAAR
jgi:anti-anti-sigma factor